MKPANRVANIFRMSDEAWRQHAKPWSVYTRLADPRHDPCDLESGLDGLVIR